MVIVVRLDAVRGFVTVRHLPFPSFLHSRTSSGSQPQRYGSYMMASPQGSGAQTPTTGNLNVTETNAAVTLPSKVQVCGFKDCRRVGGGKRLENLVNQVLQEEAPDAQRTTSSSSVHGVQVEICDCLGECGYGPNLFVDGRLINGVRGRQAVLQALGLAVENKAGAEKQ
jgi:hypothetical protein